MGKLHSKIEVHIKNIMWTKPPPRCFRNLRRDMICICCPLWNEQLFSFWEDTSLVWRRGMRYTWLIDFHLHNTQKKNHINGIYYVIYIHPLFGVFQSKPQKPPPNPQFPTGNEPSPSGLGFRRGIFSTEVPRRIQGEVEGSTLRRLGTSLRLRITSLQLHWAWRQTFRLKRS